jgi:hypothetical protein
MEEIPIVNSSVDLMVLRPTVDFDREAVRVHKLGHYGCIAHTILRNPWSADIGVTPEHRTTRQVSMTS